MSNSTEVQPGNSFYNQVSLDRTGMEFPKLLGSFPFMSIQELSQEASARLGTTCSPDLVRWIAQKNEISYRPQDGGLQGRGRGRHQKLTLKYCRLYLRKKGYPLDYSHSIFLLAHCEEPVNLWEFSGSIAVKEGLNTSARTNMFATIRRDTQIERWLLGDPTDMGKCAFGWLAKKTQQADHSTQGLKPRLCLYLGKGSVLSLYDEGWTTLARTSDGVAGRKIGERSLGGTYLKWRKLVLTEKLRKKPVSQRRTANLERQKRWIDLLLEQWEG